MTKTFAKPFVCRAAAQWWALDGKGRLRGAFLTWGEAIGRALQLTGGE